MLRRQLHRYLPAVGIARQRLCLISGMRRSHYWDICVRRHKPEDIYAAQAIHSWLRLAAADGLGVSAHDHVPHLAFPVSTSVGWSGDLGL